MSRYSIALNKQIPKKRTRRKTKKKKVHSTEVIESDLFDSAVDLYSFMFEKKGVWEADTAHTEVIVYINTESNGSAVITIKDWDKTKHFVPVSFSVKIQLRDTIFFSKKEL